jgi:hypothetical protein
MGLVGVALRIYENQIQVWTAEHEYLGIPANKEEMACNQIELHTISDRIQRAADYPEDRRKREELWRRIAIEFSDYCYGRKMTEEELLFEQKMWAQLREDMAAGKPASGSEAALYLREVEERYPRKSGLSKYPPGEAAK